MAKFPGLSPYCLHGPRTGVGVIHDIFAVPARNHGNAQLFGHIHEQIMGSAMRIPLPALMTGRFAALILSIIVRAAETSTFPGSTWRCSPFPPRPPVSRVPVLFRPSCFLRPRSQPRQSQEAPLSPTKAPCTFRGISSQQGPGRPDRAR